MTEQVGRCLHISEVIMRHLCGGHREKADLWCVCCHREDRDTR